MSGKWIIAFFLISTFFIFDVSALNENYPRVITPLGGINGFYKISHKKHQYEAYEGIPYAKPPVGDLRFEPPLPVEPWSKDLNATKKPNKCMQISQYTTDIGVEDCLYLNVYVPSFKNATPFPVLVFIHGGGFQEGYSWDHQPTHIIDKNVILVTINYRLGPFGFLSTHDDVVPGNMGLKDQSLALKWINDNIRYFGGDKKRITLSGCSAGSASVHYHYLSPMSTGLFQNGISSSGTAFCPWAFDDNPMNTTTTLAKYLNCTIENNMDLVRCLKRKSALDINTAAKEILDSEHLDLGILLVKFKPVAEKSKKNYFINRSPKEIIKSGDVYDVPWIAGTVSGEAEYFTLGFRANKTRLSYVDKNWETTAPYILMFDAKMPENKFAMVANAARYHYFGNKTFEVDDETTQGLIDLTGDTLISYDVEKAVKLQASVMQSPVQFYYFDFYTVESEKKYGVPHCADCNFIFTNNNFDPSANQETTIMLERVLNFVHSVVSGDDNTWRNNWPKVNPNTDYVQYIHIRGPDNITYIENDNFAEKQFWNSVL